MADNYKITGQRSVKDVQAGNQIVDAIEVTFTAMPSNATGVVRIPAVAYSPTEVDHVVGAMADTLNAVADL